MFISRGEPLVRRPAVVKAAEATRSTREAVAPPCRKPPEFLHRESISQKPHTERERERDGSRAGKLADE